MPLFLLAAVPRVPEITCPLQSESLLGKPSWLQTKACPESFLGLLPLIALAAHVVPNRDLGLTALSIPIRSAVVVLS